MVVAGDVMSRKIAEIESGVSEFLTGYSDLVGLIQGLFQYPSVLSEDIVDVADIIVTVTIQLVVKGIAAKIGAEFLVDPSFQRFAALGAFLLCSCCQMKKRLHEHKNNENTLFV
jgi:hypothetical protein